MNAYQDLANAIIIRAVKDYRTVLHRCKYFPQDRAYAKFRLYLEQFFLSSWFECLTDLDGEVLMRTIETEVSI